VTPADKLRARAEALEAEGKRLKEQGKYEEAATRLVLALDIRAAADEVEGLQRSSGHAKVVTDKMLSPAVRKRKNLNISETQAPEDPFAVACREAGYSIRSLAKKLGFKSHGTLFNYLAGERAVPRLVTKRIEKLIGWADTDEHWPRREPE